MPIVDVLNPRAVSPGGSIRRESNRVEMELEVGRERVVQGSPWTRRIGKVGDNVDGVGARTHAGRGTNLGEECFDRSELQERLEFERFAQDDCAHRLFRLGWLRVRMHVVASPQSRSRPAVLSL